MDEKNQNQQAIRKADPKDHLANERTFLAWVRTSIGIMAFGFVVEKFTLFIKQISFFLGNAETPTFSPAPGYSSFFGVALVSFGAIISLLACIEYKRNEKQINNNTYQPSMLLNGLLTFSVLLMAIFLIIFLKIHSGF